MPTGDHKAVVFRKALGSGPDVCLDALLLRNLLPSYFHWVQ